MKKKALSLILALTISIVLPIFAMAAVDAWGYHLPEGILYSYAISVKDGEYLSIPNGVKVIAKNAFNAFDREKWHNDRFNKWNVTIPDSVLVIEEYAFYGYDGLTRYEISSSVIEIGEKALGYSRSGSAVDEGYEYKIEEIEIVGFPGSAAERYAKENGFKFTLDPRVAATPTSSTVLVNGSNVAFDAYNIQDNNYFKLRDLAYVLNGTEKQFSIWYEETSRTIYLDSGYKYTPVGDEMAGKGGGEKSPTATSQRIFLNGKQVSLIAYNIDGNNYFKLRDLGAALNFGINWDGANNTIVIDTAKGYAAD